MDDSMEKASNRHNRTDNTYEITEAMQHAQDLPEQVQTRQTCTEQQKQPQHSTKEVATSNSYLFRK